MMPIVTKTIPSSKGNLAAAIHYPDSITEQLAILCPGYLDTKDYVHLVRLAEALAEHGYTVVRFDPTGTWESKGAISEYTTTQYLADIKNVLEYMLEQGNYKHILLGGHSRGGMNSVLFAAYDPRISLVLGIMPSSGRSLMGRRRTDWKETGVSISFRDLPNDRSQKKEFRVPYSHVEDRDRFDVLSEVKKIKAPIILLAGELDDLVLPEDVKKIYENANEPKKFIIIEGIGHDYRHSEKEIKLVNNHVVAQLDFGIAG